MPKFYSVIHDLYSREDIRLDWDVAGNSDFCMNTIMRKMINAAVHSGKTTDH